MRTQRHTSQKALKSNKVKLSPVYLRSRHKRESVAYPKSFRGGRKKFRHSRVASQTSFAFAKTARFCSTFFHFKGLQCIGDGRQLRSLRSNLSIMIKVCRLWFTADSKNTLITYSRYSIYQTADEQRVLKGYIFHYVAQNATTIVFCNEWEKISETKYFSNFGVQYVNLHE